MTTFYLCRHGESENNQRERLSGWIDTPLTERGKVNARSSATKLANVSIDRIISSDLGRAFMTAYIIARHIGYSDEIETAPGLRENNYGVLANQPYDAYPKLPPEAKAEFVPKGGESLNQMQERVLQCLEELADTYDGRTVLLVAHDGTINAIRAKYSRHTMGLEDELHNPHDFVARLDYDAGKIQLFEEVMSGRALAADVRQ